VLLDDFTKPKTHYNSQQRTHAITLYWGRGQIDGSIQFFT